MASPLTGSSLIRIQPASSSRRYCVAGREASRLATVSIEETGRSTGVGWAYWLALGGSSLAVSTRGEAATPTPRANPFREGTRHDRAKRRDDWPGKRADLDSQRRSGANTADASRFRDGRLTREAEGHGAETNAAWSSRRCGPGSRSRGWHSVDPGGSQHRFDR